MARSDEDTRSRIASCADYDSQEEEELADTRKQANVAAKRTSHSSNLGKEFVILSGAQPPLPDISSDSGYSSRTQATVASADSGQSIKAKAAARAATTTSETNTAPSHSSNRDGKKRRIVPCNDPNCTKEHRSSSKTTSSASPNKSAAKASSKPSSYSSSRPQHRAEPLQREAPRNQQEQARPRASSGTNRRPHSFYGVPAGPAPPMPYYTGPGYTGYNPQAQMMVNRSMALGPVRPEMPHRVSDISARSIRPGASYPAPIIKQEPPRTNLSARRPPRNIGLPGSNTETEEETSEEDDESEEEQEEPEKRDRELEIIKRLAAAQALQQEQRRRHLAAVEKEKARLEADRRAMPPPNRPASTADAGQYSMRRPPTNATPKITYGSSPNRTKYGEADIAAALRQITLSGQRPPLTTGAGPKATTYSYGQATGLTPDMAARPTQVRRASVYAGEKSEELEAMLTAAGTLGRENEARRLQQMQLQQMQQKRLSGDLDSFFPDTLRLGRFQDLPLDHDSPSTNDDKLREAQAYMGRVQGAAPREPVTEGAMRRLDRDARSSHSKRSSQEGSTTTRNQRRTSVAGPVEARYDADGLRMRIDTQQDYEIDIGGQRVELRPSGEGSIDLYIGGKRETSYPSTRGSTISGSKLGRQASARRARDYERGGYFDDDESDTIAEREGRDEREERRNVRAGATRRRAETYGSYATESRRAPPRRAPSQDRQDNRARNRVDDRPRDRVDDRARDRAGDRYTGPPRYGVAPDEYSSSPPTPSPQRYGSGYPRYQPPSPRQGHGYSYSGGSGSQNYQGFGA